MVDRMRVIVSFFSFFVGCMISGFAYSHHEVVETQAGGHPEQAMLAVASVVAIGLFIGIRRKLSSR